MFLVKKSDFINLCKSMGKDPEFEKLRAEVLSILKKQAKSEGGEKSIHKSLDDMDKSHKYFDPDTFSIKTGYPVETIKSIDGDVFIKSSPSEWELVYTYDEIEKAAGRGHLVPKQVTVTNSKGKTYTKTVYVNPNQLYGKKKYSQETHGAKVSVGRIIAAVNKCENVEQLMKIVMANKDRFVDANGNHLPIVDKIRAAADKKNEELSNDGSKPKEAPEGTVTDSQTTERVLSDKKEPGARKKEGNKETIWGNAYSKKHNLEFKMNTMGSILGKPKMDQELFDELSQYSMGSDSHKLAPKYGLRGEEFLALVNKVKEGRVDIVGKKPAETKKESSPKKPTYNKYKMDMEDERYEQARKDAEMRNAMQKESPKAEEKKTPKAEKKKSFKKEMDELYDAQDAAWEGFNSGSEIKATPENSKKFYERVKKFVDDNNIKLSQKHYAEIEDNNGHSFNEALALAGAYGPDMKEKALKGNKKASEKYKGTRLDLSQIDEFKNEESEAEKHKNRSDAMKGNQNAKKYGLNISDEDFSKVKEYLKEGEEDFIHHVGDGLDPVAYIRNKYSDFYKKLDKDNDYLSDKLDKYYFDNMYNSEKIEEAKKSRYENTKKDGVEEEESTEILTPEQIEYNKKALKEIKKFEDYANPNDNIIKYLAKNGFNKELIKKVSKKYDIDKSEVEDWFRYYEKELPRIRRKWENDRSGNQSITNEYYEAQKMVAELPKMVENWGDYKISAEEKSRKYNFSRGSRYNITRGMVYPNSVEKNGQTYKYNDQKTDDVNDRNTLIYSTKDGKDIEVKRSELIKNPEFIEHLQQKEKKFQNLVEEWKDDILDYRASIERSHDSKLSEEEILESALRKPLNFANQKGTSAHKDGIQTIKDLNKELGLSIPEDGSFYPYGEEMDNLVKKVKAAIEELKKRNETTQSLLSKGKSGTEEPKKEPAKTPSPEKQKKLVSEFSKKFVKDMEKRDARHSYYALPHTYNINGKEYSVVSDGRVLIAKNGKSDYDVEEGDKIPESSMNRVYNFSDPITIDTPQGIDEILKDVPNKISVIDNLNGVYGEPTVKKIAPGVRFGEYVISADYLKMAQKLFGNLSDVKVTAEDGDISHVQKIKLEKGDYSVVVMPIITDEDRIYGTEAFKNKQELNQKEDDDRQQKNAEKRQEKQSRTASEDTKQNLAEDVPKGIDPRNYKAYIDMGAKLYTQWGYDMNDPRKQKELKQQIKEIASQIDNKDFSIIDSLENKDNKLTRMIWTGQTGGIGPGNTPEETRKNVERYFGKEATEKHKKEVADAEVKFAEEQKAYALEKITRKVNDTFDKEHIKYGKLSSPESRESFIEYLSTLPSKRQETAINRLSKNIIRYKKDGKEKVAFPLEQIIDSIKDGTSFKDIKNIYSDIRSKPIVSFAEWYINNKLGIKKSIDYYDFDEEYDEVDSEIDKSMQLFESASIEETVHNVLSSMNF